MALDLAESRSREMLDTLIARADVFVSNLAPGAVERLGFGEVSTPGGTVRALLPPFIGLGEPAMGPLPVVGEYTQRVLREFGLA